MTSSNRLRSSRSLPGGSVEIAQVRRRLVFLDRDQLAIGAEIIALVADLDPGIGLRAVVLEPHRLRIGIAAVELVDRPWPRQPVVDDGDVVVHDILVVFVEINPLLDDALVVVVKRGAGGIVDARSPNASFLDAAATEAAAAVQIAPFPD